MGSYLEVIVNHDLNTIELIKLPIDIYYFTYMMGLDSEVLDDYFSYIENNRDLNSVGLNLAEIEELESKKFYNYQDIFTLSETCGLYRSFFGKFISFFYNKEIRESFRIVIFEQLKKISKYPKVIYFRDSSENIFEMFQSKISFNEFENYIKINEKNLKNNYGEFITVDLEEAILHASGKCSCNNSLFSSWGGHLPFTYVIDCFDDIINPIKISKYQMKKESRNKNKNNYID